MFCPNCGYQNDDQANVCLNCGAGLIAAPVIIPETAADKVKKFIASPIVLVVCILFTVSFVLGMVNNFASFDTMISDALAELPAELMVEIPFNITSFVSGIAMSVGTIGNIPNLILLIGFWLMYSAAKKQGPMSTTGITMLRGVAIFELVMICIVTGLFGITAILIIAVAAVTSEMFVVVFGVSMILVCGVVFALFIVFYSKVVSTLGVVRQTLRTGIPSDKVSMYVAVMLFIMAGFSTLSVIPTVLTNFAGLISGAATIACSIIYGVLIISYRNMMRDYIIESTRQQVAYSNQYENNNNYDIN